MSQIDRTDSQEGVRLVGLDPMGGSSMPETDREHRRRDGQSAEPDDAHQPRDDDFESAQSRR